MNMGQAVQLSKGLAKQYRAVLAVAEAMEEIVNLEDVRKSASKRAEAMKEMKEKTVIEQEKALSTLHKINREIGDVEHVREDMLDEANKRANIIITEADNEAERIVEKAKKEANLTSSHMTNDMRLHMEEMEELNKEIQEKEEHINKIKKSLVRIRERLE